jgi:DNA modification methylase
MICNCGHEFTPKVCYDHRLLCGDCTDGDAVVRLMGSDKADCVVTDPPYGVGVEYSDFDDTAGNVTDLIDAFMPIALQMGPMALTPGVPAMWDYPRPSWVGAWVHPASTSSGPWGFVGANPILYYGSDPYLKAGKGRRDSSYVAVADRKGEDDHPVSKPLNVWSWLVERMTPNPRAIVLDPFSGSGTTLIACENLGRKCRAIEISPAYVAVALERYVTATHKTVEVLP